MYKKIVNIILFDGELAL